MTNLREVRYALALAVRIRMATSTWSWNNCPNLLRLFAVSLQSPERRQNKNPPSDRRVSSVGYPPRAYRSLTCNDDPAVDRLTGCPRNNNSCEIGYDYSRKPRNDYARCVGNDNAAVGFANF